MKAYLVEVTSLVDFDDLDADDRNDEGECAVDGTYGLRLTGALPKDPHERVLDIFHEEIGIACLDDFNILVRAANAQDIADWEGLVIHDLGNYSGLGEDDLDDSDPDEDLEAGGPEI